jgi:hypothetical protein
MAFQTQLLTHGYFPLSAKDMPFGEILNSLYFAPNNDNLDFPLHGPNTMRFLEALVLGEPTREEGLFRGDRDAIEKAKAVYTNDYPTIMRALGVTLGEKKGGIESRSRVLDLLRVAALFHDIGKVIRRANHPPIGSNLLRNFDEEQRQRLVEALVYQNDPSDSDAKHNRFSLIVSIIQHHDKFGVVTTGEAGLPLFSDILYFTSDESTIDGIRKNIASVMLVNLVDIAAVNTAAKNIRDRALVCALLVGKIRRGESISSDAEEALVKELVDKIRPKESTASDAEETLVKELVGKIRESQTSDAEETLLKEIITFCRQPGSCLGIDVDKLGKVLDDWRILDKVVSDERVQGNRVRLKRYLLDLERNPARAITRILRLLQECAATTDCHALLDGRFISPTSVESALVGTLGAHQFQTFCELLATVAKMDYGLNFFKAIFCACVRKTLDPDYRPSESRKKSWSKLTADESRAVSDLSVDKKAQLAGKITALFVRVLEGLLNRYIGVIGYASPDPRRFGFQMRDLTLDDKIRDTILELLCVAENKDAIALTWIAEEVTIWSMD